MGLEKKDSNSYCILTTAEVKGPDKDVEDPCDSVVCCKTCGRAFDPKTLKEVRNNGKVKRDSITYEDH